MTKKRARKEQISDERKRNVIFPKKVDSLTKQASDLATLCGVKIGIVIHKPSENNAVLWPSPELFGERLQKFLDFPEIERKRKMVIHGECLEGTLDDERGEMLKFEEKKRSLESQLVMNELLNHRKGFDEVHDLARLHDLEALTAEILRKLQIRDGELQTQQQL